MKDVMSQYKHFKAIPHPIKLCEYNSQYRTQFQAIDFQCGGFPTPKYVCVGSVVSDYVHCLLLGREWAVLCSTFMSLHTVN